MATTPTSESLTITTQERTWRLQIECPFNADYVLQAFRETIRSVDGEVLSKTDAGQIVRTLSGAADDEVTLESGKTITIHEMAEALVKHIEAWRAEDLADDEEPAPEEGGE